MDSDVSSAIFVDHDVVEVEVADLAWWSHAEVEAEEDDGLEQDVFVFVIAVGGMVEFVDGCWEGYFDVVFVFVDWWCFDEFFPLV